MLRHLGAVLVVLGCAHLSTATDLASVTSDLAVAEKSVSGVVLREERSGRELTTCRLRSHRPCHHRKSPDHSCRPGLSRMSRYRTGCSCHFHRRNRRSSHPGCQNHTSPGLSRSCPGWSMSRSFGCHHIRRSRSSGCRMSQSLRSCRSPGCRSCESWSRRSCRCWTRY